MAPGAFAKSLNFLKGLGNIVKKGAGLVSKYGGMASQIVGAIPGMQNVANTIQKVTNVADGYNTGGARGALNNLMDNLNT